MKNLSLDDHNQIGHYLKFSHVTMLKALNKLANKHGRTKEPYRKLERIDKELLALRLQLEDILWRENSETYPSSLLHQIYLGPLNPQERVLIEGIDER